jgi:hypothetical protein
MEGDVLAQIEPTALIMDLAESKRLKELHR